MEFLRHVRSSKSNHSGQVRVYGQLSTSLIIFSGVRQGRPASSFFISYAIKDVLQDAMFGILGSAVELIRENKVLSPKCRAAKHG